MRWRADVAGRRKRDLSVGEEEEEMPMMAITLNCFVHSG
jgi:hypothetical protein